jgi:hypothetical protein
MGNLDQGVGRRSLILHPDLLKISQAWRHDRHAGDGPPRHADVMAGLLGVCFRTQKKRRMALLFDGNRGGGRKMM